MKNLRLALDWTPNTNHIGFFVAQEKGFYKEFGITVDITNPAQDDYAVTPAKKVELGNADLALCPFESVISYQTKAARFDAVAIATVFQEDLSAIVVREDSNIKSPKDLDNCSYASYKARYEDEIVKQMIKNDGGEGSIQVVYPQKLGIWQTVENKTYDATWIFMNWEGVEAKSKGLQLRSFKLADFGIPYSYSPIIMGSRTRIMELKEVYSNFLSATKKGFLFSKDYPEEAAKILSRHLSESDRDIDLLETIKISASVLENEDSWGVMSKKRVQDFIDWLSLNELETSKLNFDDLVYPNLI